MAIKVNLLPREVRAARSKRVIAAPRLSLGGTLITQILAGVLVLVLLTFAVLGYRAWAVAREHRSRIAELKTQNEQLKSQLSALRQAEAAKREIQRRIEVIGKIAKSQGVPVAMLNGVLGAVPDGIWLSLVEMKPQEVKVQVPARPAVTTASETLGRLEAKRAEVEGAPAPRGGQAGGPVREVTQLAGYSVVIRGAAFNNFQVADFMENLRKNSLFADVDFVVTQAERIERTRVMTFEVTATVKL